jgi:hypothetical protein
VGETTEDSPRAAIGWDEPSDVQRVVAHELGHTWGQLHTPCNRPLNIDPSFPYPAGNIGVYGYDATANSVILPSASDIMGYCSDPWISDYIYNRVLTFRQAQPSATASLATVQPCVLIWGRIVNGRPVLEPAFQVMARPRLPAAAGPYSVEGVATDGSRLFSLSFDAASVADDPRASRHFAFAVPLDQARASRVGDVRLSSPQGTAAVRRPVMAQLQRSALVDSVKASRHPTGVTLTWNAAAHPMIMVRDPDTGEVLSLLRGGRGSVLTRKNAVELNLSDGVQSHRMRLFIRR